MAQFPILPLEATRRQEPLMTVLHSVQFRHLYALGDGGSPCGHPPYKEVPTIDYTIPSKNSQMPDDGKRGRPYSRTPAGFPGQYTYLVLMMSAHLMARVARVVVPGLPHHVMQRGNRRQPA
jgi:hypothetical protein